MCVNIRSSSVQGTAPVCNMETKAPDSQDSEQNHGMYKTSAIWYYSNMYF